MADSASARSIPKPATERRSNAPAEVSARPASQQQYIAFTTADNLGAPYELPSQFLQGIRPEANALPETPLIVFINARSGGNQGPALAVALSRALGRPQVFDLSVHKPEPVLAQLWENFRVAAASGAPRASWYQSKLRILVAGGDGTITWVLSVIKKLKLSPMPAVAIMPLGTGNDLSRSLGWGAAFENSWIDGHMGLYNTLVRISNAKEEDVDCWSVHISYPSQELVGKLPYCLNIAQSDLPPSPPPEGENGHAASYTTQRTRAKGLFWNYVSVGLDARAAYNFHHLREEKPACASNRIMNQFWYSVFSCTSGWFCCTKPLSSKARIHVQRPGLGEWVEVHVPNSVKAIVVLNLQSYAGGRNLWGEHQPGDTSRLAKETGQDVLQEPSYNDGRVEVVGLLHGIHTASVMATKGNPIHALRICQAAGVRISLKAEYVRADGQPSHAYLQVDGEPWIQDVPSSRDAEPIIVEISHQGVSKMLHSVHTQPAGCFGRTASDKALPRKPSARHSDITRTSGRQQPQGQLGAPLASVAGTINAESDMAQMGSEHASSMHSGPSWTAASTTNVQTRTSVT